MANHAGVNTCLLVLGNTFPEPLLALQVARRASVRIQQNKPPVATCQEQATACRQTAR